MKTLFTFFATVFLITTLQLHAEIVYLNNNLEEPNISENIFINWSDAYAAASAGDTIYVFGSNADYGSITIDKPITIIGPGYFLSQNMNTQVNKLMAAFGNINLIEGSQGSKLIGIANAPNINYDFHIRVSNITIISCYIHSELIINRGDDENINNVTVSGCFLNGNVDRNINYDGVLNNFVFTNNILNSSLYTPNGSTGMISHNLFMHNTLLLGVSSSFEFSNNIYLNDNENNITIKPLPDASVHHNISLSGAFGDANDNFTAPQSTLFITGENASTDGQYMLSENSPARGAGSNGTDIGPFGGPDPYRLSGLPNLPNIYELSTGGFVSGDELPVTIKIKQ